MNKLGIKEKIKTVIKELNIETKFEELTNNLDIRLIKGSTKSILNIAEYISNRKSLKIKLIDSNLKKLRSYWCDIATVTLYVHYFQFNSK